MSIEKERKVEEGEGRVCQTANFNENALEMCRSIYGKTCLRLNNME